jgi:site-specific DNA recombinase
MERQKILRNKELTMANMQKKRCAIYTRKSVEEGLDMEFNSLDAHGWRRKLCGKSKCQRLDMSAERYDDGGFSGGNLERPALKKLLDDAANGLVDIIVIYKLDRLSRSICDFAELSKKFDEWGVSFVSVTQEINTSTSSGRMMLNILMTFAQYEREIIAERIRDKMSASRKRGQWVGGSIPFGYFVKTVTSARRKKFGIYPADV